MTGSNWIWDWGWGCDPKLLAWVSETTPNRSVFGVASLTFAMVSLEPQKGGLDQGQQCSSCHFKDGGAGGQRWVRLTRRGWNWAGSLNPSPGHPAR